MTSLDLNKLKQFSVRLTLLISVTILLLKLISYFLTNSMAVLSLLLDSTMDILLSLINFFAIYHASRPPDDEHRYGHGKLEALSALAQGAFIIGFACVLFYEMVHRLIEPAAFMVMDPLGIALMALSTLLVLILISVQKYVIKKTGSVAIKAEYLHYKMDFWLNLSVFLSLLLLQLTGFMWLDIVMGMGIAFYLLFNVKNLLMDAIHILMDRELPQKKRLEIAKIVSAHPLCKNIHDLRTRYSCNCHFVEFHIEMDGALTLYEVHQATDEIEDSLKKYFAPEMVHITIHQEPYGIEDERYAELFEFGDIPGLNGGKNK